MKPSHCRRRRRGAFTLVEVLLVLVILVILGSLAATEYGRAQRRAKNDAAASQIGLFKTALGMFQLVAGDHPTTDQGLEALREAPADLPNANVNDWPMLDASIPKDPWGHPYQYERPGRFNTTSYDLWSWGPDGDTGTDDDIGNWEKE